MRDRPAERRRDLLTALLAESVLGERRLADPSNAIVIMIPPIREVWGPWAGKVPATGDLAGELAEVLTLHGVRGSVKALTASGADAPYQLSIHLEQCDGMPELVTRITAQLATDSVRILKKAFAALKITDDRLYATSYGTFVLGNIGFLGALALYDLFTTDPRDTFDENDMGWAALEDLAARLSPLLSEASGGFIDATAKPACDTCSFSRTHEITLGSATPAQAQRLAASIHHALSEAS